MSPDRTPALILPTNYLRLVDVFLSRYEDSSTAQTGRRSRARRAD